MVAIEFLLIGQSLDERQRGGHVDSGQLLGKGSAAKPSQGGCGEFLGDVLPVAQNLGRPVRLAQFQQTTGNLAKENQPQAGSLMPWA